MNQPIQRSGVRARAHLERLGKTSKEIACTTHDVMVAELGDAADKLDTVTTKLSKLINDKPEGLSYFFAPEHPVRLRALARALGLEVATLKSWRASDSRSTLVLDPRLNGSPTRILKAGRFQPAVAATRTIPSDD